MPPESEYRGAGERLAEEMFFRFLCARHAREKESLLLLLRVCFSFLCLFVPPRGVLLGLLRCGLFVASHSSVVEAVTYLLSVLCVCTRKSGLW